MGKIIIDVNAEVTSKLGFEPVKEYDNFVVGHLISVRTEVVESKEDAKWEFKGMSFKRLVFEFKQQIDAFNDRDRFMTFSLMPVQHYKEGGVVARDADKIKGSYIELWKHCKHIHDQFAGAEGYRPITVAPEFDDSLDEAGRIEQFNKFAENMVAAFLDAEGKPFYNKTALTIKAIASGQKNAYYSLPDYVGKGYLEPAVIKNGKLHTALKFAPNETTILGGTAIPTQASNPVQESISSDIMAMINASKK